MISTNPAYQCNEDILLDAFYRANDFNSLLFAISQYLYAKSLKSQFSIAYKITHNTKLSVKHCFNSKYHLNQTLTFVIDSNNCYWVTEVKTTASAYNLDNKDSCLAVPFHIDGDLSGFLILEGLKQCQTKDTLMSLSTHLGRNLTRLELSQLYIQQHQHDALKLSSIERIKTIMRELDLDRVLSGFIDVVSSTVSGSASCLILCSPSVKDGKKVTEMGITSSELDAVVHTRYGTIIDYVMEQQQAWLTVEENEFKEFNTSTLIERINSFLILPINVRDGSGCIFIADPENINEASLEISQTIVQLSSISMDNALLHSQVVERAIHKQQLKTAGSVQNSLLPEVAPDIPGINIFGLNVPCDDTSGDYYDFIKLPDGKFCFVLGDATGHGIGAAILATTARAMLRALLKNKQNNLDLVSVCTTLNNLLDSDLAADKFITMFIGLYNPFDRSLTYVSAGHDPPLMLYLPAENCFIELQCTGLPLGALADMNYDISQPLHLEEGTKLILMSDGIPEAVNTEGHMYGKDRVKDFIRENAHYAADVFCQEIVNDVSAFRGTAPQTDDITIISLNVY